MIELTIKRFDNNIMQIENIGTVQKWNNDNEQYGSLNEWVKDIPQHSTTIHKRICLKNAILLEILGTRLISENASCKRDENCCKPSLEVSFSRLSFVMYISRF